MHQYDVLILAWDRGIKVVGKNGVLVPLVISLPAIKYLHEFGRMVRQAPETPVSLNALWAPKWEAFKGAGVALMPPHWVQSLSSLPGK